MNILRLGTVFLLLLGLSTSSWGNDLSIARVFADGGVLQQGVVVPIWGTARPGSEVVVEFAGQSKVCKTGDDGKWYLELDALIAQGTGGQMSVKSDRQAVEINDLLVGEVWYASGQSNMQMTLAGCAKHLVEVASVVEDPKSRPIRTLRLGNPDSEALLTDFPDPVSWQVDNASNRPGQSAVAYYFARALFDELKVPIGIIEGSWGGKPIEGFIPGVEFEGRPELKPILELAGADELEQLKQLEGGVIIRNTAGMPGRIFNARVAPVAPYAVKGFIWYQGESNSGKGEDPRNYRHKMQALVEGWRNTWNQSDLPFYYVQLPAFKDSATGWVRLREEQRLSLAVPNTGMAVAIDLRDERIHPPNKIDVGRRLARWALAQSYDREISFSGPLFSSADIEGDRIRVKFKHASSGLMVGIKSGLEPPVESKEVAPGSFELNDGAGNWLPAEAKIEGQTLVVTSAEISKPVAVRYACEGDPESANLYNREGLPASPFCSDLALLPWEDAE